MYYHPDNPHDEKEEFYEEKELTQEEIEECESSDGSYDAEDFVEEEESIPEWKGDCWDLDVELYGAEIAKDIRSIMYHMYTFLNFSDSISLHYIAQIFKELGAIPQISSLEGRKKKC